MNNKVNEQQPEWPREVCIKKTLDAIVAELGDDYDEDDNNGLVASAIIDSMSTIEIESWEEIPDGYEVLGKNDQEDYQAYLESKESGNTGDIHYVIQAPPTAGTIRAVELQHGKLYDCTIEGESGPENCRFVQLAIDATSNRRFMLLGAKNLLAANLDFVHKLINMSFNEIDSEDFDGDPDRIRRLYVWEFILDEDGILKGKSPDCYLYGFTETVF